MANNFLNQLQMVVDTGKLQGVTNIKDLYEHFKDSGIGYKDFKKQMHDYGIYGHLGKHDMARLSGMYYGSKNADFQEGRKAHMIDRDNGSLVYKDSNLAITPTLPQTITPLNIPVSRPVIQKTAVISAPKNNSNKQQVAEVTKVVIPTNSGDPNNFGIVRNTSNSSDVFTGNRYYLPGVKTREFEEWTRNHPNYWKDQLEQEVPKWSGYQDIYNYFNSYENPYSKGYMNGTQRLQTGGQVKSSSSQQDAVIQFVKALAQTLQADPQQIVQAAQENPEALKSAVQVYQETQGDMQKAAQAFSQALQSKTQAVKHGAKLNYLKSLKNKCAEDEELYYFKKGGKAGCGCKKKEDGGKVEDKKESVVSKFKKACGGSKMKFKDGGKSIVKNDSIPPNNAVLKFKKTILKKEDKLDPETTKVLPNGKYPSYWTADDKIKWERKFGPKDEGAHYAKEEKCGGKMKKHQQGGSLNGIPFIRKELTKVE